MVDNEIFVKLVMEICNTAMQPYSNPKSPKKFTQPQLMACLVLKNFWKTTYRGVEANIRFNPRLVEMMGFKTIPDHSTIQKFADRVATPEAVDSVLAVALQKAAPEVTTVAIDSTGLTPSSSSAYFQTRSGRKHKSFVKLSVVVVCGSLFPICFQVSRGPSNDKREAYLLMSQARLRTKPELLLGDAGYDAEWVHKHAREELGMNTIIPLAKTASDGSAKGRYRSQMKEKSKIYGMRWHVESFFSAMKRTTGSVLLSMKPKNQNTEAALHLLTYAFRL